VTWVARAESTKSLSVYVEKLNAASQQLVVARKRLAQVIGRFLNKSQLGILSECFNLMALASNEACLRREIDEAHSLTTEVKEKSRLEKQTLVARFGQRAMASLARKINADAGAILQQTMSMWIQDLENTHKERDLEAERERTKQAAAEARARAVRLALSGTDSAIMQQVFPAWKEANAAARAMRERKAQGMTRAFRAIASSAEALLTLSLGTWRKVVDIEKAARAVDIAEQHMKEMKARSREQKLKAAEIAFAGVDQALLLTTVSSWHAVLETASASRRSKGERMARAARMIANSDEMLLRRSLTSWAEIASSKRRKAMRMEQALRRLGAADKAFQSECFLVWSRAACDAKNDRRVEQERRRVEQERAAGRKAREQMLARMFGRAGTLLLRTCMDSWKSVVEGSQLSRKCKEHGMAATVRRIMSSEATLQAECVATWATYVKQERIMEQLGSAQAQATLVAGARKRALAMFERSLNTNAQTLLHSCLLAWRDEVVECQKRRQKRDQLTSRVVRDIAGSEDVLRTQCFSAWLKIAQADRDMAQERGRRRRCAELGRFVVIRLRDRLSVRLAFSGWMLRSGL